MGVPKFYRWISERYPCLSEVVKEFQLPEFDNLYLDMNGIIHVCSHPDDENPHFRITEEKIFKDICHYIDFLFRMIKPRRAFFMAVDGVAPRAKMNQQRGRRFRSAREADMLIKKAEEMGEVLPTEKRFDSNCITPGTPFMVRLQEHLKYFVVDKISSDPLWHGTKVYLSGHETPGEGEHKVMDFIRYSKSQADYDPDTRHCLYGLDADLIMLGLTSHDPHFSLLREEVRFGGRRDRNKRPVTPEETTFHLLHLSLMRDYLAYEFSELQGKLPFPWDLEKIIDDWILMGFLVGNDFIPHLPHLHIQHDALPLLWKTYKSVLPTLDGYINESGHLNLPRFEKYFQELSKFDLETFESAFSDLRFLESKLGGKTINESIGPNRPPDKLKKLEKFKVERNGIAFHALEDQSASNGIGFEGADENDDEDDEYDDEDDEDYNTTGDEFNLHKRDYYMSKMAYPEVTPTVLQDQAHGYIIAIQWILLYYFEGCPSWSWFYRHHYAPYISDVRGFSGMKITFDLSTPFLPFQQLMAVLPAASKDLLPPAYQHLMTDPSSPILDFYPVDFETDLNGKQQDWEAVVLIPFIAEERLLEAMASREHLLTREEKSRNHHGPHLLYQYTPENMGPYPSSLPGIFPDIQISLAKITELGKDLFHIDANRLRKGLLDTVRLDVYFPGFPTLKFLPHTHQLAKAGVKVFQHNSRGESMTLRVQSLEGLRLEDVADELLGKVTHVGWPHLHEAQVIAVANESYRIELIEHESKKSTKGNAVMSFNRRKLDQNECAIVAREAADIKERLMNRFAIDVGQTEIVVYACPMTGRTYTYAAQGAITLEKQFASDKTPFLHQMTVKDLKVEESGDTTFKTLDEVFPVGSNVFMVGNPHYGAQGKVQEILPVVTRVRITLYVTQEPDFRQLEHSSLKERYLNNYQAAQQIGIDSHIMSRITGCVFVEKAGSNGNKINIGLNLKLTKRGEEVPGYTKKTENGWSYSYKCVKTVEEYINKFHELWLIVQQQNSSSDFFQEEVLFSAGCTKKLADVTNYLDELPCTKVPKMKFGSEILDEEQVEQIERMTASLNPKPDIVKVKVKPKLLFRPLANQGCLVPDPGTDFFLYDRVVVVKSGYSVPFGRRGTIIGIPNDEEGRITPNSLYDVVFDESFTGGITLRCSPGKGYRVPGSAMLNLTYGEFRKGPPTADAKAGGRPQQSFNYNPNGSGHFGTSHTNSNNSGGRTSYSDRIGHYNQIDRAGLWKQQQQGFQQTVRWENGQPLFGQVFGSQNQFGQGAARGVNTSHLQFLTPKVQGPQTVPANRGFNQPWKITEENKDAENSEFNNMWRNLQSHQSAIQGAKVPDSSPKQTSMTGPAQKHQSPSPNNYLNQPPQQNSMPRHLLQQQPRLPQSVPLQPPSLFMSTASQQHQTFRGQLQPQLGGLLPRQPGQLTSQLMPASSHSDVHRAPGTENSAPPVPNVLHNISESLNYSIDAENTEFAAVFNSLKIQNEEQGQRSGGNVGERFAHIPGLSSSVPGSTEAAKSQADLALKQLLKIGLEPSASPSTTLPAALVQMGAIQLSHIEEAHVLAESGAASLVGRSTAPVYGRHLSLQELFEEANRQQQQQQEEATVEQQNLQLQQQNPVSRATRDPIAELEAYCKHNLNIGTPQYDYKSQPKQNAYIANVILQNGQRFEGSLCRTKEEAVKSAASMAILCLNSRPTASHPAITGYPPGTQRTNVNRLFSANSAFSPIGIPGPNPNVLPRRPPGNAQLLLTPQLFINQPPPPLSLQLLQQKLQQQMQHQHQQHSQHHVQNFGMEIHQGQQQQIDSQFQPPYAFQGSANLLPVTSSQTVGQMVTPASSVIQQFIPLQVSRNQKHPNRRKDSESDRSDGDTKTHHSEETHTPPTSAKSGALTQRLDHENKDKNGLVFEVSSLQSPTISTASVGSSKSATPTARTNHQKKKSRLAANFGTKLS